MVNINTVHQTETMLFSSNYYNCPRCNKNLAWLNKSPIVLILCNTLFSALHVLSKEIQHVLNQLHLPCLTFRKHHSQQKSRVQDQRWDVPSEPAFSMLNSLSQVKTIKFAWFLENMPTATLQSLRVSEGLGVEEVLPHPEQQGKKHLALLQAGPSRERSSQPCPVGSENLHVTRRIMSWHGAGRQQKMTCGATGGATPPSSRMLQSYLRESEASTALVWI